MPPSVSDDDLRRWERELWQLECESRFQAGAAERGALSGDVTCIYVYALAPDDAVRGLLKVVVTAYEAFIDDVCVHPESYRLGVCYELCSRFATFAIRAKLGCIGQTVRLQVRDSNTVAVHTYENMTMSCWERPQQGPYLPDYDDPEKDCMMMSANFDAFADAAAAKAKRDEGKRGSLTFVVCVGRTGAGLTAEGTTQEAADGGVGDEEVEQTAASFMQLTSDEELTLALAPGKVVGAWTARRAADVIAQIVLIRLAGTIAPADLTALVKLSYDGAQLRHTKKSLRKWCTVFAQLIALVTKMKDAYTRTKAQSGSMPAMAAGTGFSWHFSLRMEGFSMVLMASGASNSRAISLAAGLPLRLRRKSTRKARKSPVVKVALSVIFILFALSCAETPRIFTWYSPLALTSASGTSPANPTAGSQVAPASTVEIWPVMYHPYPPHSTWPARLSLAILLFTRSFVGSSHIIFALWWTMV